MSLQTLLEARKKTGPVITSSPGLVPPQRPSFAAQTDEALPASTWAQPDLGHNLSRMSIYSPTNVPGINSPEPAAQACPLPGGPRACPFGGACHTCPTQVQTKLAIGQPGDTFEQEADEVAERVMRMPEDQVLQRRCSTCSKDEDEESLQAKELPGQTLLSTPSPEVPPIVHEVLRSPGQPLDPATRAFMEPRFGYDFSRVRIHTDIKADESARTVNAKAYTVGHNIVFAARQYAPATEKGKRLLAHELTHVNQQVSRNRHPAGISQQATEAEDSSNQENATGSQVTDRRTSVTSKWTGIQVLVREEDTPGEPSPLTTGDVGACVPSTVGFPPNSGNCSAYLGNSWWLPLAYVNNATCACLTTPNSRTANCVRQSLQDRLAASPTWLKIIAAGQKINDNPLLPTYPAYQGFVQTLLTPRIYRDHVDAYASCCCPSGPAPYPSWIGVTTVPIQPCNLVGLAIRHFGSCHGTPGRW